MIKRTTKRKKGKKTINYNKTTFDGIDFASNLEVFSYKQLKLEGLYGKDKLLYEAKTFEIIEPFVFDGKKYQNIKITPDFVDEKNKIVLEIKGIPNELFPMRWKLLKRYFSINDPTYKVFLAIGNQENVKKEIAKIKELYK